MAHYVQKSFARGILSPNSLTRFNIPSFDEALRDCHNMGVGRQGELFRRGGSAIVASFDKVPSRLIPFYSENRSFIIALSPGRISRSNS